MKTMVTAVLVVFAALSASVGVLAAAPSHYRLQNPATDLLLFLEGVGEGLVTDFGNLTECVNDSTTLLEDFDKAFTAIDLAIKHKSISELVVALKLFGVGVDELALVLKDCGDAELIAAIADLAAYFAQGPEGVIELIAKEILNVFADRHTLGSDFREAIKAWQAKPRDFKTAGLYTGEIIGIFIKA